MEINYKELSEIIADTADESSALAAKAASVRTEVCVLMVKQLEDAYPNGNTLAGYDMVAEFVDTFIEGVSKQTGQPVNALLAVSKPGNMASVLYARLKGVMDHCAANAAVIASRQRQALVEAGAAPVSRPAPLVD